MYRFCLNSRIDHRLLRPRYISSSRKPVKPPDNAENAQIAPQHVSHHLSGPLSSLSTSSFSRSSDIATSATVVSALLASVAFLLSYHHRQRQSDDETSNNLFATAEQAINKSRILPEGFPSPQTN